MLRIMSPLSSSTLSCESASNVCNDGSISNGVCVSVTTLVHPRSPAARAPRGVAAYSFLGLFVVLARHGLDVDETGPRLHLAREEREVLAQRVPLEVARQVEMPQVRVAVEHEAVHLPALTLVPVGAR